VNEELLNTEEKKRMYNDILEELNIVPVHPKNKTKVAEAIFKSRWAQKTKTK